MEYILMNKETQVLEFLYDSEIHTVLKIEQIFNPEYAPLGIIDNGHISRKLLNEWWKDRAIPASRSKFKEILSNMNITSSVELLELCYGLSLSDQYWIKEKNLNISWEDINFFENDFSEDMGKLLMGEIPYSNHLNLFSPDNSSDGNLQKKWKIINKDRYLIKGGNDLNNQEPFNEVIATKLYERILNKEDFVPYTIIKENNNYYSCCKNMINTDEELIAAFYIDRIKKLHGSDSLYEHYVNICEELKIPKARASIDKMIVCDYILSNYDRHYRNFGVIRNIKTLQFKCIAPLFDSGSSLYANTPTIHIGKNYSAKPFKTKPKEQLRLVKSLAWFNPDKLVGFTTDIKEILSQNPLLDENRISMICNEVTKHIKDVIDLKNELENN